MTALAVALVQPAFCQNTVFVDVDAQGAADGTSWADAFPDLQVALFAEGAADYWVAEGVYKPGASRFSSFNVPSGAKVYGGFSGNEASLDERDVDAHITKFSGDLSGNDVFYLGNISENSLHVVRMFNTAAGTLLDGVVVEGGYAFGSNPNRGAGLDVFGGHATVNNCTFRFNVARDGAAVSVTSGADVTFNNCFFDRNETRYGKGAGINVSGSSTVSVNKSKFDTNHSTGGTYQGAGAGINAEVGTTIVVCQTVFVGNKTEFGCCGGLEPCVGGAICSLGTADLRECRFLGNKAHNGGALYLDGEAAVENCEFSANNALAQLGFGGLGGGVVVKGGSNTSLRCCTFYANLATVETGGLYVDGSGSILVDTSIFFANVDINGSGAQSQIFGTGASHSCIQNMLVPNAGYPVPLAADFPNSFADDPMFVDAKGPDLFAGNENDDLRLLPQSPCIDVGNDASAASGLDNSGANRYMDGDLNGITRLDMGSHEFTHAVFELSIAQVAGGVQYTGNVHTQPGMTHYVFVGRQDSEQSFAPYGSIWWDVNQYFGVAQVGVGPESMSTVVFGHTAEPIELTFQALAIGSNGLGNFSNPVFTVHE